MQRQLMIFLATHPAFDPAKVFRQVIVLEVMNGDQAQQLESPAETLTAEGTRSLPIPRR